MSEKKPLSAAELLRSLPPAEPVKRYPISRSLPYCSHHFGTDDGECLICGASFGAPRGNVDPITGKYIDPRIPKPPTRYKCPAPICNWFHEVPVGLSPAALEHSRTVNLEIEDVMEYLGKLIQIAIRFDAEAVERVIQNHLENHHPIWRVVMKHRSKKLHKMAAVKE